MQGVRAAESLLHPPQRLRPAASSSPPSLQADPGAPVQTLPGNPRGLQGLQRCVLINTCGLPRRLSTSHLSGCSAAALADVTEVVEQLQVSLMKMENFQKLLELKKDLLGVDNLVVPGRVSLCSQLS